MFLALFFVFACTPTCEEACKAIVACGNEGTELLSADACEEQCNAQRDLYDTWEDAALQDAFDDSLTCYKASSCDDLAAGACYNEDLWAY